MLIKVLEMRQEIDQKLVGVAPMSTSVKPGHIANGLFRAIIGEAYDTKWLNRFVVSVKDNGQVPEGHELSVVYDWLHHQGRIDPEQVSKEDVRSLRILLKKILNADEAVYLHKDLMESYSAGYTAFISRDRIAQHGGEFVAAWLMSQGSPLSNVISTSLKDPFDPITSLCCPLLSEERSAATPKIDYSELALVQNPLPPGPQALWDGLRMAAETLSRHLHQHPNKLSRLRLAVLFSSFVTLRHLTCLESYYLPNRDAPPLLLDFSNHGSEPVAQASLMTYALCCQSISRFYAWAFSQRLSDKQFTLQELKQTSAVYKGQHPSKEASEIWKLALLEAERSGDPLLTCGQALYDLMALEAEGDPIRYLRQLGLRSGLMWPPENFRPSKRFAVRPDMLEVLIRGSVEPGEPPLDMPTLQDRLWRRFGVVVGGRPEDERALLAAGVYQANATALRENRARFATHLGELDFARLLADGVLQVELEVSHATEPR